MAWCLFSYPWTKLYTRYFVKAAVLSAYNDDSRLLGVKCVPAVTAIHCLILTESHSVIQYATLSFLLGQASMILEYFLSRQLKKARADVYEATVRSRGKPAEWWSPYCEEWLVPPFERAQRAMQKQSWYARAASPLIRMLVVKGAPVLPAPSEIWT